MDEDSTTEEEESYYSDSYYLDFVFEDAAAMDLDSSILLSDPLLLSLPVLLWNLFD